MDTLRSFSLAVCCLIPAFAASPTAIPLAFEQREPALFIVHSTSASVRFQPDRVAIGEIALRFLNARPARLEGIGPVAPATYMGDTGRQTFQQYPRLAMRRIYAGIDAVFYGHDGHLEYDLEVAPGGEPSALRLRFENARSLRLSDNGALLVEAASGALQQLPPRVFQAGRPIAAHYLLTGANEAAIRLGKYDRRLALTIDPELVYANYFGGSGSDAASAVATDSQGNVYLAGSSNSLDFPSAAGSTSRPLPSLIALTNAGQSVTQITIGQGRGVTAIGGTPDGKILYAASGSTVYYSSNSGASWIQTSAIPAATSSFYNSPLAVTDISVDAIDPSRAFVATNRGLFSTGDNGNSWFPRDYDLAAYYDGSIQASSVTISQVDHTVTYVTTGNPNFLYKSTDAGGTFTMLNATFSGEPVPPPFPASTIIFTLAPGGSDLYVVDANGYLFKSVDAGVTWQKLYYGIFGAKAIRIDPNNNANIFVQDSSGVQKSTDGGSSFTTVNPPGLIVADQSSYGDCLRRRIQNSVRGGGEFHLRQYGSGLHMAGGSAIAHQYPCAAGHRRPRLRGARHAADQLPGEARSHRRASALFHLLHRQINQRRYGVAGGFAGQCIPRRKYDLPQLYRGDQDLWSRVADLLYCLRRQSFARRFHSGIPVRLRRVARSERDQPGDRFLGRCLHHGLHPVWRLPHDRRRFSGGGAHQRLHPAAAIASSLASFPINRPGRT